MSTAFEGQDMCHSFFCDKDQLRGDLHYFGLVGSLKIYMYHGLHTAYEFGTYVEIKWLEMGLFKIYKSCT